MKPSFLVRSTVVSAVLLSLLPALVWPGLPVRTAYACTGSIDDLSLDHFANTADAIVIVDVSETGGAENETPPLPPGTPIESAVGGGHIPDGFDFEGYRATAMVRHAIAGDLSGQLVIDAALRAELEQIVRRWELGERLGPCFFGMQDRYQPGASYLVFLARAGDGWETLRAYEVDGGDVLVAKPGSQTTPYGRKPMIVSRTLLDAALHLPATRMGEGFEDRYGELWALDQERVPLSAVLDAIAEVRTITPPATGSAGLRSAKRTVDFETESSGRAKGRIALQNPSSPHNVKSDERRMHRS